MKLGNINKDCKIHGLTLHGLYSQGKYKSTRCLECACDKQKLRRSNPIKKQQDLEYTLKWNASNPAALEKYKINALQKAKDIMLEKKQKIDTLFALHKSSIQQLLIIFGLSYDSVYAYSVKHNLDSIDQIRKRIISKKRQLILDKERWKISSVIKYHNNVRENFQTQTQELKNKINSEATRKAKKYTNKKIKELITKLDI